MAQHDLERFGPVVSLELDIGVVGLVLAVPEIGEVVNQFGDLFVSVVIRGIVEGWLPGNCVLRCW